MTSLVTEKAMKKNVWQMPKSSPYLQRSLVSDNGHLLVRVLKRSGYSMEENSPQEIWDHIADKMLLEFAESGCPIFRAPIPLSRCNLQNKGHGKLSIHFAADHQTIETVFRIIVFANQLSLYGAVANMCEEFESHQDRSGQPGVLMGNQLFSVKSRQKFLWRMTSHHTRIFYCNEMKNESNCFTRKQSE